MVRIANYQPYNNTKEMPKAARQTRSRLRPSSFATAHTTQPAKATLKT